MLGPTFAPLFGSLAKSAAIGFMMFNMFHGTLQPLAGAARTLSQLSEDGMAPRFLAARLRTDAPWAATLLTAGCAILFLLIGDPIWLIAAANFCYLIGFCLPSVAVWLRRRDAPLAERPYRAPRGTIVLGLAAAGVWAASALLGFEQFGLPTVVFGLLMAYSGAALYAWRKLEDRGREGRKGLGRSLHVKLTGAMLLVIGLDAAGYILAIGRIPPSHEPLVVALEDIFVLVAALTISVGIVLPGMIAHSADQVSAAARRLAFGTLRDFAHAMDALGAGNLGAAHAAVDIVPVVVRSRDELGTMAESFNSLQHGVKQAALGLDRAREGLSAARSQLIESNTELEKTVEEQNRLTLQLLQAKEAALHDAMHDPLTGLPNRTLFMRQLQAALVDCRTGAIRDCAVFFIDLDRFKIVNDSMGHIAGNDLITQVAGRLRELVRGGAGSPSSISEFPRRTDTLARMGGDEFTLLLAEIEGPQDALRVAGRIQDSLSQPFIVGGQEVYTSASIGIASNFASYASADDILRDADLAMYRAKSLGKARAELYHPTLHASATARLHLENDLRRALQGGEFVLHYQPIVSFRTRAAIGFEALVRWQFPGVGLIYPGDFITVAEETGIIVPLGRWVLGEACRTARKWQEGLRTDEPLTISVNISPRQFAQRDLIADAHEVLVETGVEPATVKLEITESSTMEDPERVVRVLSELKSLGVQLCIDDFGTGYSSLSYLHRFPLDILKIDRSFVSGLLENAESYEIIATIMALAGGLGMKVVAEGVEVDAQIAILQKLGCDFGQGNLFSKPVPGTDVPLFLQRSTQRQPIIDAPALNAVTA